jgi:hypothetical protein
MKWRPFLKFGQGIGTACEKLMFFQVPLRTIMIIE